VPSPRRPRPSPPPGGPVARIPLGPGRSVSLWNEDALASLGRRAPHPTVVVTSPPYNRGVPYRSYSDARPREEYLAWMRRVGEVVGGVLVEDGSFFLNVGGSPSDPWLPWDVAREVGRTLVLQNVLHWIKSIAIDHGPSGAGAPAAFGHYKPLVSSRYVHGAHEYVFQFTHRGDVPIDRLALGVPYQDRSNVRRWQRPASELRCRGNTWFLPYATIRSRARDRPHPATFPTELPEWCVRLHGVRTVRQVVDPFVGIGSSAVAAARLGLDFVGFDLDAGYLAVAAERVRAELASRRSGRSASTPSRSRPSALRPARPRRAGSRTSSASA
jgi:site-specific DNA-methyltransferase (adenine-specific)